MKLARKLMIALVLGVLLVMGTNAVLRTRFERRVLDEETDSVQYAMGLTLMAAVEAVFRSDGAAKALRMVSDANDIESRVNIRWVWLAGDDPEHALLPEELPRANELRDGRSVTLTRTDETGDERRYTLIPFVRAGLPNGALEVWQSLDPKQRFLRESQSIRILTTVVLALVSCLIASTLLFWFVGRPIRLLRDAARRIGAGDFSGRLSLRQGDEIGELAGEINAMCGKLDDATRRAAAETEARIAAIEQLRHADRLTTVGRLASGVAHELGTPLNIVSEMAEMIAAGEGEARQNAHEIVDQTERMTAMIRELLDFSRRPSIERAPCDLGDLVHRTVALLEPIADKRDVALDVVAPDSAITLEVDRGMLQQALTNLIVNAVQASPHDGRVAISLRAYGGDPASPHNAQASGRVAIEVSDRGAGIAPEHLPLLFEPFFTTKAIGEGTGLGLSVAYGIVRDHGGSIEVESRVGEGSTFRMILPTDQAKTALRAAAEVPA